MPTALPTSPRTAEFRDTAEKLVVALAQKKETQQEIDRLEVMLGHIQVRIDNCKGDMSKYVGNNVKSKAISIPAGIVVVRQNPRLTGEQLVAAVSIEQVSIEYFPHES